MTNGKLGKAIKVLVIGAGLAVAGQAQAQSGGGGGDDWVPVKHLTFGDDEIEGGILTPDGTRIESIASSTHPSLIELREGFEAEIVKTMEDM